MNAIPFGPLQFANRLKAAGFTDEQAQVLLELQQEVSRHNLQAIRNYRRAAENRPLDLVPEE